MPACGGVVLCTMRMKQILEYDFENLVVRVQPGVLLNDLAQDALTHGLMYCPDPGEKFATLGGNVSTNAGGMRAVKYGATRDYVRAMTVVLPTGDDLDMNMMITLNSTARFLWERMEQETTKEELVDALLAEYGIDRGTAQLCVDNFVEKLVENDFLA